MPEPLPAESPSSLPALFVELLCETWGPLYSSVRGLLGDDEPVRDVTLQRPPTTHGAGCALQQADRCSV